MRVGTVLLNFHLFCFDYYFIYAFFMLKNLNKFLLFIIFNFLFPILLNLYSLFFILKHGGYHHRIHIHFFFNNIIL